MNRSGKNIGLRSLLSGLVAQTKSKRRLRTRAAMFVHKRRRNLRRVRVQISRWEVNLATSNNRDLPGARLLSNVDLLFFVYVAKEINQTTNKRHCCQSERYPTRGVTTCGIRISHESVEVKDRTDGCGYADNYRQNVFQAFHFEPPARKKYEG